MNSQDEYGDTPLTRATFYGMDDIVHMLLNVEEIDVDKVNQFGQNALSLSPHMSTTSLLYEHKRNKEKDL